MKVLESARECVQANMIAWVQYPNNMNRECFVYPQYLKKDGVWFAINSGAFPNNGSFLAFVTGASDAQQINEQYGSLVVARVNVPKFEENFRYEATRDISSKFKVAINPDFHRGNSDLEFEIFSETSFPVILCRSFLQIALCTRRLAQTIACFALTVVAMSPFAKISWYEFKSRVEKCYMVPLGTTGENPACSMCML